jgi:hypothetical protein
MAQVGDYLGPGILSRGAGSIGERSGQPVNLRFYLSASGFYDNGLQPFSVDSTGHLKQIDGQSGEELTVGLFGTHSWKSALLGVDYEGTYRHYSDNQYFDGSDQRLALGYSIRKTKRFSIDMRESAGTSSRAFGYVGYQLPTDIVNQPTSLLFDNRTYYTQSTVDFNYIQSARTILTAGGDVFAVRRQSSALVGLNGYSLRGSAEHRLSKNTSIGVVYQFLHFDYPRAFGQADLHTGEAFYSTALSKRWTFTLQGGITRSEVRGQQNVAVDPVIAALTGQLSVLRTFYRENVLPSGAASLVGHFKQTGLNFSYTRTSGAGNGLYLTSRIETAGASLSYTATRRLGLSLGGGYSSMSGLAQGLSSYSQFNASGGMNYNLLRSLHLTARYDARQTDLDSYLYHRLSYRVSFGVTFSPGEVPLAFW